MILFIHQTKHIGGGQSFVDEYQKILKTNGVVFDFFQDSIDRIQLVKNIFQKRYSSVFLNIYTPNFLLLVFLLRILGVHTVITVYGIWFLELHSQHPYIYRKKKIWLRLAQGLYFFLCRKLIVFSEYEQKLVQAHYKFTKNKTVIIPGGVDLKRFYPLDKQQKSQARKRLALPIHSNILLVLSRLDRRKGLHMAIDAFYEIIKNHPNSFLCVVFPSDKFTTYDVLHEAFEQVSKYKIGDKVHFITGVEQSKTPLYFQSSDIFLMSSIQLETFGLTTVEAAACGTIPIGFKSGATPEILTQVNSHLIVSSISPKSLARGIEWILSLPDVEKVKLKHKCVQLAKTFSWKNITTDLIKTVDI